MLLNFLRRSKTGESPREAWVPKGVRVYAVGDIHGRADLLTALHDDIFKDAAARPGYTDCLVYLGDYIDRGLESRRVLDIVAVPPPPGFGTIHLRGNHEQAILDFLENPDKARYWLDYGGAQTLFSYGIHLPAGPSDARMRTEIRDSLLATMPKAHLSFLRHLRHAIAIGDYLFVHAGIKPGVPIAEQSPGDMLWIRTEFLTSREDFGKIVVHGHTISHFPDLRPNRIGIDTGAFASGRLTCLVLEENRHRFLST